MIAKGFSCKIIYVRRTPPLFVDGSIPGHTRPPLPRNLCLWGSRGVNGDCPRCLENEVRLSQIVQSLCEEKGLEFKVFSVRNTSFDERLTMVRRARFIVAVHGGLNFHFYWAEPTTTFVEIVMELAAHSLAPASLSLGLYYWYLPVPGADHYTKHIIVPETFFNVTVAALDEQMALTAP
eukprot:gnl/Spiro4/21770_TR10672_c0_g1_i1.p1 gnl/Spiro4/21770_TR10672_c0_g1~~gnl/Spiro4/21770_TR10672_c0_g1_i1.p1  ORF type:complete len:179 (-),score=14.64 gnl/Spiro4/21770_TR10672_c0_g1_i1:107-643(-)